MTYRRLRQVGRVGRLWETRGVGQGHKAVQLRKVHDVIPSSCYDEYDLCSPRSLQYISEKRERQVLSCAVDSIGSALVGGPESEEII
jgi:hypothetical protein